MQNIKTNEFQAEVLESNIPVLVDFWATWCGPCRMVAPILEELAKEYESKAKLVKVNVDEEPELAQKYGIMSIPAMLVFRDGQVVEKLIGARPKQSIAALLDENI